MDPIIKKCDSSVYMPSDDSYLLIDYFQSKITPDYIDGMHLGSIRNVLDLGTGSGVIALSLLLLRSKYEKFNPKIYASDVLDQAIRCAKINEKANGFAGKVEFILSDLFASFPGHLKYSFDVIIFNPPYLPSSKLIGKKEKTTSDLCWDGGEKGNEIITRFIGELKDFLNLQGNPEARAYFVSSSRADTEFLDNVIQTRGFKKEVLVKKHVFFEDIVLNRLKL